METREREWSVEEVRRERISGTRRLLIVDVRSPGEFAGQHNPGAVNIRWSRLGPGSRISTHRLRWFWCVRAVSERAFVKAGLRLGG
jgi:3-mercaptopyruvate sulfurtransferase SseA